jgi:hypothetical protein
MAQQTINIGTAPNDGTGTPLRTSFDYCNLNFTELYTAVGPSGNNIVVPGNATITGDLTVDTSTLKVDSANDRVSINTTTFATDSVFAVKTTAGKFDVRAAGSLSVKLNSDQSMLYNVPTGNSHLFQINDSDAMTLNSTGLGVGAGPGLTGSSRRALTVNAPTGQLSILELAVNSVTTGYLFSNATQTSLVSQGATFLTFDTNSNERMRIDSSGNLGVGVTPSAWNNSYNVIDIGQNGSISGRTTTNNQVDIVSNGYRNSGGTWVYKLAESSPASRYLIGGVNGSHSWYSGVAGTAGNIIAGFSTASMTLDASGNLLVKRTTPNILAIGFQALADGSVSAAQAASVDGTTQWTTYSTGAAAYRFYVGMGGTVFATNTTISAISDARLKENVQDIDVGLSAILSLKPRKFDWKAGKGKDIKGDRGFIAQEFEQVFPNLIDEWKDAAPEGEAPYKSVRQDLIPVLVKAIQELTARVQTLEAK